jgi:uncharacterized damage-inducible protein DinB
MTVQNYYSYLTRARRDLWAFLETLPYNVLSESVIPADRMHSIKDLVLHIAVVEDSWIHEDILRDSPVWESTDGFPQAFETPYHDSKTLTWLLEYWRAVEQSTLAYFETLSDTELERDVPMPSEQGDVRFKVRDLLWHVMQHETRHTAQIVLLARLAGHAPPQLDLVKYLWREAGQ